MRRLLRRRFSISPLDDRYAGQLAGVERAFSEAALTRKRVIVEVRWLQFLYSEGLASGNLNGISLDSLENIGKDFSEEGYKRVKEIEAVTKHDVKAVEYFVRERLVGLGWPDSAVENAHFLCTSEDINNLSYALMVRDFRQETLTPTIESLVGRLTSCAENWAKAPLLARTHGQPASPTTLGKEFANFANRLAPRARRLAALPIRGKFNGAVGNFNAHVAAFPGRDWPSLSKKFVEGKLGLTHSPLTTQIEPHDWIADICAELALFNSTCVGLSQDIWWYISRDIFKLKTEANEVGSSAMPHKVNPIDFENAEGNLGLSNALLEFLARKLPVSRLQRDLSDSTVLRNLGVGFGHSVLAYSSLSKGLAKLSPNIQKMNEELDSHWEVLAEAIQQVLRREGVPGAYETLKALTRGKQIRKEDILAFVKELKVSESVRKELLDMTPASYTGIADQLVGLVDRLEPLSPKK